MNSSELIEVTSTTVIIVTLNRPVCVRRCLEHLRAQERPVDQLIVVDASADQLTRDEVARFPGVIYIRNENGFGRMTASRNIGLVEATGDVIAFLDDDAFADPRWHEELLAGFGSPTDGVGAVGGRVIGDSADVALGVGQLLPNGRLIGNFGREVDGIIDVDHVMGCNMSFRRGVLAELGGFREDYPGISGIREDTDMLLRVRAAGYRVRFNPRAVVEHIGAPQMLGRRFDWRYQLHGHRNHIVLLTRHRGFGFTLARYVVDTLIGSTSGCARAIGGAVLKWTATLLGLGAGMIVAPCRALLARGAWSNPRRNDESAESLRSRLNVEAARQPSRQAVMVKRET